MDKKIRILVAEDSATDRELFQRVMRPFMKSKVSSVEYVPDGEEAMRSIKEKGYDILFLDESMPGPTGLEIAEYIKKNHRAEKVIILTGYPDLNEKFSKMMGADEYVEKPVDSKALEVILGKYAVRENSNVKN